MAKQKKDLKPVKEIPPDKPPAHPHYVTIQRFRNSKGTWSATERLIALMVTSRMNPDGICWPSARKIAEDTGLSERAVFKGMKRLTEGDAPIFRKKQGAKKKGSGRGRQSNRYEFIRNPRGFAVGRLRGRIKHTAWIKAMLTGQGSPLGSEDQAASQDYHRRKIHLQLQQDKGEITQAEYEKQGSALARTVLGERGIRIPKEIDPQALLEGKVVRKATKANWKPGWDAARGKVVASGCMGEPDENIWTPEDDEGEESAA